MVVRCTTALRARRWKPREVDSADIEVAVSREDDAIDATVDEPLLGHVIGKTNATRAVGTAARRQVASLSPKHAASPPAGGARAAQTLSILAGGRALQRCRLQRCGPAAEPWAN